jgi:NADH-quinone oxidoreductase subunit L
MKVLPNHFPIIVLDIGNLSGLISLPTNSWLNEYLAPLFTKVATEEHHFGTSEYMLMLAVIGGLWGIELHIQIHQTKPRS